MDSERGADPRGVDQPEAWREGSSRSAVCLETGEVDWMELESNSNAGTSVAFLDQLRRRHSGPMSVIRNNAPAPH